jgi:signal transduction histidine kinase/CHASE1-domain containing sensor protein
MISPHALIKNSRCRTTLQIMLVALVYWGLGKLGLALAIPPGYASPVFPAAGFAVAIMLWSERRAWLGIVLGSLLLNIDVGNLGDAERSTTLLTALGIAAGSTLQAQVAATLVERLTGSNWRQMESTSDITRILLVAGPSACLVSASIGVATLGLGGKVTPSDLLYSWWIWWTGDVLGVLVALPLSLAVLLRKHRVWHMHFAALGLPMLTVLGVIVAAYVTVGQWEREGQEAEARRYGEQLARLLEQRFIAHEEALAALKRLIEVSPDMSYAHFEHFTRITLRDNQDIFALSFNPYVLQAERAAVERRLAKATNKPDLEIKERDASKRLVRAGERPEYVVVGYIAPLEGNRPAIGYDINSEPVRQDAIRRARASRHLSVTSTIQLVQENQKRVGALLLYPAYRTTAAEGTPADPDLLGFAVGVIKLDQMVQIATAAARDPGLVFRIDDVTGAVSSLVFQSEDALPQQQAAPLSIALKMADRNWQLTVYPTASYRMDHRSWISWATGVVGLLLAALLQMLLLVMSGRSARTEQQVAERTEEMEAARAKAEKSSQLLREAVSSIAQGFTIYDENDRLVICNDAYRQIYATSADLIVPGNTFEQILRAGAERGQYAAALGNIDAWVKERVAQHQSAAGEVIEQRLGDGRWLMIVEHRTPSGYIAGNRIDITTLKQATAALEDRNVQLDALFHLSPDGLVLYDQHGLGKFANPAFLRMTGLLAEDIVGRSMAELEEGLRGLAENAAHWHGLDECFLAAGKVGAGGTARDRQRHLLELRLPRGAVLEFVGVKSEAGSVGRLLYVRDVTHEIEVDRMKSEFLSHAAHELRTPMASIFGFSELLISQEFDEETRKDLLATIHKQTAWLIEIINELLDLARIEARRGKDFKIEAVDAGQLVVDVLAAMQIDAAKWPVNCMVPAGMPPARADQAKLRQALMNVIGNAVKYSPQGGHIEIAVDVRPDGRGRTLIGVTVTDQGIGMTSEQVARVCERFYRADTSGNIPGTGLGMAIVKETVELMGGHVEIASTQGKGTTISLWLPAAVAVE